MKKLTAIEELPQEEAEAVSSAVGASEGEANAADAVRRAPTMIPGGVRRIRSRHHRHRHFRMEKLAEIRHRQDVRALAFILPLILLVIGLGLFGVAFRNNDPTLRPEKLMSLSWCLMTMGGGWLLISTIMGSYRNWKDAKQRAAEENAGDDSSTRGHHHHRHRRHHFSSRSGEHHHYEHRAYAESIARAQQAAAAAANSSGKSPSSSSNG